VATIEKASKREKMRTFLAILPFQFPTNTPVFGIFGYIKNTSIWRKKHAKIFVRGNYLFQTTNSFPRNGAPEKLYITVSFDDKILSKKNYINKHIEKTKQEVSEEVEGPQNHHRGKEENHKLLRRNPRPYKPFMKPDNKILY